MQHVEQLISISPDIEIISRIIQGERNLFEILIRRYNPVLYKTARAYGFNHQDAEDLMQDAHVSAYQHLHQFGQRASYKTWLCRILIHKCLYRLRYGHDKYEIQNDTILSEVTIPHLSGGVPNSAEKITMNRELSKLLEASLQEIPLIYRTVFVLREIEGFSVAETAELLTISPVNVKVRLNRAKALLQKQLEQFYTRSDIYEFNLVYCDAVVRRTFEAINKQDL
ncbi:MAG TPA: sigma-70 family RNA polymerase sigma factor [Flavisolibacter sp.]